MNVAIITDSFPPLVDGVSRCVLGYANALHEAAHCSCFVVAPKVPKGEDVHPFPVYRFNSFKIPKAEYRAGHPLPPRLFAKIKDMNIDIIHAHSPFISMSVARQLRKYLNVPVVFTQHTKWDYDISRVVSFKTLRKPIEWYVYNNINAADEVWAVSRGAGEHLCSHGFGGKYIVMPNGTDFPEGAAEQAVIGRINTEHNLPEGVPVLLFVGRMLWYKNIKLILEAMCLFLELDFDFRMVFVGDGEDFSEIKKFTLEKGSKLSEKVIFAGKISDRELLRGYFSRSDLFIFPSVYDNAPLVIREAAACSLPSVVVAGSSASEILEDKTTGFFSKETAQSVADVIRASLGDRELLKRVGENARSEIYMPWEKVVAKSLERYEEVLKKYNGGTPQ